MSTDLMNVSEEMRTLSKYFYALKCAVFHTNS